MALGYQNLRLALRSIYCLAYIIYVLLFPLKTGTRSDNFEGGGTHGYGTRYSGRDICGDADSLCSLAAGRRIWQSRAIWISSRLFEAPSRKGRGSDAGVRHTRCRQGQERVKDMDGASAVLAPGGSRWRW